MKLVAKQIHQHLAKSAKILIVPHQNPDGDALGSLSALTEYLKEHGQKPVLFCHTPAHKKFDFLRHITKVLTDPKIFQDEKIDTIVILDSSDLRYAGIADHVENTSAKIVNIDHHHTNEKYGDFNLVVPNASSTSEIMFNYFRHNRITINHHMATALLTGLVTDTENFSNGATTTSAMQTASELLRRGGNLNLINKRVMKNKSIGSLKLWGAVFSRLNKSDDMVYTYITQTDLKKFDVSESEAEGIANFLNNLDEAKISLILRETEDGKIKASFRTTRDNVDVSAMAKKFGGGGHKKAAGFTIEGNIENALRKILTIKY